MVVAYILVALTGCASRQQPVRSDAVIVDTPTPQPKVNEAHDWGAYSQTITTTNDVHSAEQIPVPPGAQHLVQTNDTRSQPWALTSDFDADSTAQDLAAFYEAVLPRSGWKLSGHESITASGIGIEFLWLDTKGVLPYRLLFVAGIGKNLDDARGLTEARPCYVNTTLVRWPYALKVPMYPNAQQVQVRDVVGQYGEMVHVTAFVTGANPQEVDQYYSSTLPQYGWRYSHGEKGTSSITEGLNFDFSYGGPEQMKFSTVTVTAREGADQLTYVEMHATGDDVSAQPKQ